MPRPSLHQLATQTVTLSLDPAVIEAAARVPGESFALTPTQHPRERIADCVRRGVKERDRAIRIGAEGHELSTTETGLEVLFKVRDAHGARVLADLIRIYEERMQNRETHDALPPEGRAVFGDHPAQHNLPAALTEMRSLADRINSRECVVIDSSGKPCLIQFLDPEGSH